ncbi:thiolase family protein [Shewanella halifaxensis]|uniref:thiolase family protein n=1 Tax=Shewanella halifaxensis TaxID=271098 RepID=UPI000D597E52|nr:thiolase family protein [Shewanella halifaxensis]
MSSNDPVVIVSAKRTPMGSFLGGLCQAQVTDLGATAIKAAVACAGICAKEVDEVLMGCVLPAGAGQAPARQAALKAGLADCVGATTVNKVCGSGIKTLMQAHDAINAASIEVAIAGGMESMSNAPYLLAKAREGYRMGHGELKDHMMLDGLEDAYQAMPMGALAQITADKQQVSREAMDAFAIHSAKKACYAAETGAFLNEIEPVVIRTRKGDICIRRDEGPELVNPDKIPKLKPVFAKSGTITAANASSISDGAAALVLMKASKAEANHLTPLCRIVAHASHAQAAEDFTLAPIGAINALLDKAGWQKEEVDLWEINEAFAMVTMLAVNELGLDNEKVNVNGGACALGHPLGASGARIVVTLIHALKNRGLSKGVAALCIGGGEAVAIAVEVP